MSFESHSGIAGSEAYDFFGSYSHWKGIWVPQQSPNTSVFIESSFGYSLASIIINE